MSYINVKGHRYSPGRFDNFDEAVTARKAAEKEHFGEDAYDASIAAVPRSTPISVPRGPAPGRNVVPGIMNAPQPTA